MEQRVLSFSVADSYKGVDAPVTAQLAPVGVLELQSADNLATASPLGGASNIHLPVSTQTTRDGTGSNTDSLPVGQPSAAKGGGAVGLFWLLATLFYGLRLRRLRKI